MQWNSKKTLIWLIVMIIAVILIILFVRSKRANNPSTSTESLRTFAQCLKNKGAVFYGAFWCPHCKDQKDAFGGAQGDLPYVECSTPDGEGQLQACQNKQITGYPTWIFADGSRLEGQQSFDALSQKTGCPLPNNSK